VAQNPASVAPAPPPENAPAAAKADQLDVLLNLADEDPSKLSDIHVAPHGLTSADVAGPTNTLDTAQIESVKAASTGDLLKQIPTVSGRRLSGINVDPRVRGYNSSQINANANGMTQRKSIQDIDSLFSQIDPGIIHDITVIDGPYTALYGPGFAFISADLIGPERYERPEMHSATTFNYTSNGQILYGRENVLGGGQTWGTFFSYGVRSGNDYRAGGADSGWEIPSGYRKWDAMLGLSFDINAYSRIEFDMLHTDMNDVDMPGVVYDLESSANNQFNLRYIIQEDPNGPREFLAQAWHQETRFHGDASNESKQRTFYQAFIADAAERGSGGIRPDNTLGRGYSVSTGVRLLRTVGRADEPQWTFGVDWRRFGQRYLERTVDVNGYDIYDGYVFGIPESRTDDVGALTHLQWSAGDRLSFSAGGRVDYTESWLNTHDVIVSQCGPEYQYFYPGVKKPNYMLGMTYFETKYTLNEHDVLNVGSGFAMRSPDLSELYSYEPYVPMVRFGSSYCDGRSQLKPEKNWQFDLGVTSHRGPFHYGARGFYATIHDYITPIPSYIAAPYDSTHYLGRNFDAFYPPWRSDLGLPSENGDTCQTNYQIYNINLATLSGGELFGQWELRKGLTVFGCMAYVHGENLCPLYLTEDAEGLPVAAPLGGKEPLWGIYPFNGRLSVKVFDPEQDKWGMEFIARFVHRQDEVATSLSELPSAGFSVYDLKGYYRLRKNIRLSLALENLLNRDYYEPGSLVILNPAGIPTFIREPGFSAILGLDGRF